jgi:hypothetical protein
MFGTQKQNSHAEMGRLGFMRISLPFLFLLLVFLLPAPFMVWLNPSFLCFLNLDACHQHYTADENSYWSWMLHSATLLSWLSPIVSWLVTYRLTFPTSPQHILKAGYHLSSQSMSHIGWHFRWTNGCVPAHFFVNDPIFIPMWGGILMRMSNVLCCEKFMLTGWSWREWFLKGR